MSAGAGVSAGTDTGFEATLVSAKAQGKTAVCIWFHYLAGKGADWDVGLKQKIANQFPWVAWYFPDAPHRPVTNYGGRSERAWFDQLEGEVTETMETPGLEASVSMVHALLRQAEMHGFPSNRIMLGGMSQGGVLAMAAGFSYEKPIAGIIGYLAWVPPCLSGMMRQPNTPLLLANGDRDEVVPMHMVKRSSQKLKQAGVNRMTDKVYPGLQHSFADYACTDVAQAILGQMPKQTTPNQQPDKPAAMMSRQSPRLGPRSSSLAENIFGSPLSFSRQTSF
jgi:predicted esterase